MYILVECSFQKSTKSVWNFLKYESHKMGTVYIVSFERKKIEVLTSQRLHMLDFCAVPIVCIPKLYLTSTKYLVDFLKA